MSESKLKIKNENPFMSNKMGLSLKLKLLGIRSSFKILGFLAPPLAERVALRLFLTPPSHITPKWHLPYLLKASQSTILVGNKSIQLYQWGHGPSILLVHAWGGRGSQLSAFIDPLVKAGYSVLTFDGPAHGNSTGKSTDMFEFAAAIHAVASVASPLHGIIAHSFGAACTLLSLREYRFPIARLILIGCPATAIGVTEDFAEKLSISKQIISGMRKQLEKKHNNRWKWDDLSLIKMIKNTKTPTLIIHDENDHEISYQQALELNNAGISSELFTTKGYGHRRILRAFEAINKSLDFIKVQ